MKQLSEHTITRVRASLMPAPTLLPKSPQTSYPMKRYAQWRLLVLQICQQNLCRHANSIRPALLMHANSLPASIKKGAIPCFTMTMT